MNISDIVLKSVRRRYRQIIRASLTTLLAVFFVTAVLIFEENMYQWQMASNKDRFGDWFIMEIGSKEPNYNLTSHIYLEQPVTINRSVNVLNDEWENTGLYVGCLSEEGISQSHIKLDEGRQPQNNDEIAMDWNTLLTLGYEGELGEDISLHYCENNSVSNDENRRIKTYKLVGIYRNYTNIWNSGKQIPSAIVSEDELEAFNYNIHYVFLYPIKSSIRTDDYKTICKSIKEKTGRNYVYNSGVYDYKTWGTSGIYVYMYLVVMAIGITALSYQLIEYRNTRKASYQRYAAIGADSLQLRTMYIIENAVIIIPSAIAGVITAMIIGAITGRNLENMAGFTFYTVNASVILKSIGSVIIAVVIEELAGLVSNIKESFSQKRLEKESENNRKPNTANVKSRADIRKSHLKSYNVYRGIVSRLMKKDGLGMIAGIRLFALCVCVILVLSGVRITTSVKEYINNDSLPDVYGYTDPKVSYYTTRFTYIAYFKDYDKYPYKSLSEDVYTQNDCYNDVSSSYKKYNMSYDEIMDIYTDISSRKYRFSKPMPYNSTDRIAMLSFALNAGTKSTDIKTGNTNIIDGISPEVINGLNQISGIASIDYSVYESERSWFWDNQDYTKMGIDKLKDVYTPQSSETVKNPVDFSYADRYLFATEYVNPTQKIYDIASKYIDESLINYDDFKNGKQVIVFLQDNCFREYDNTLSAGDTLYYNYYAVPFGELGTEYLNNVYRGKSVYSYDVPFYNRYNNSGKVDLYNKNLPTNDDGGYLTVHSYTGDQAALEIENIMGACVSPKVAAVVKVTDEVKADFNGIIPDYGYYTVLASEELAKQAIDSQKDLMQRITGEELTDDIDFNLEYNQISIKYDLSSTFSATNNKVALYLKNNNITYKSNVDDKNIYRTQLVNNILQYGITILAVVIIQVFIMAIIIRNRIDRRLDRLKLLRHMGMTKGRMIAICMYEVFRESLWCILTMPFIMIAGMIIYAREINKIR